MIIIIFSARENKNWMKFNDFLVEYIIHNQFYFIDWIENIIWSSKTKESQTRRNWAFFVGNSQNIFAWIAFGLGWDSGQRKLNKICKENETYAIE